MNSILDDLTDEDRNVLKELAADICLKAYFAAGRAKNPSGQSVYGSIMAKESAAKRMIKIILDEAMSPFPHNA